MGASPPNAMFAVMGAPDSLQINAEVGSANVNSAQNIKLDDSNTTRVKELVDELHKTLKDLPVEEPKGVQDIYGLGIGIQFGLGQPGESGSFEWENGGANSGGCDGYSNVQPTDAQKQQFKKAVELAAQIAALSPEAEPHLKANVLSFI